MSDRSWLETLRSRKGNAGKVFVTLEADDIELEIDLQYPTGLGKSKVSELFRKAKIAAKEKTEDHDDISMQNEIQTAIVRACLRPEDDATDDELAVIIAESGGWSGHLLARCSKLCGLEEYRRLLIGEPAKSERYPASDVDL